MPTAGSLCDDIMTPNRFILSTHSYEGYEKKECTTHALDADGRTAKIYFVVNDVETC